MVHHTHSLPPPLPLSLVWFSPGCAKGHGGDIPQPPSCPHVSHYWHNSILRVLQQCPCHWGARQNIPNTRWVWTKASSWYTLWNNWSAVEPSNIWPIGRSSCREVINCISTVDRWSMEEHSLFFIQRVHCTCVHVSHYLKAFYIFNTQQCTLMWS